jgi:hypothetical protein
MMEKYKFTPGPWKVSGIHQAGTHISPPPRCSLDCISVLSPNSKNDGFHTIVSFCFREIDRKEEEEAIANAELIAAAPETKIRHDALLVLAKKVVAVADAMDDKGKELGCWPYASFSLEEVTICRRIVEEAK